MIHYPTVFIVDDDDAVRNSISTSLALEGFSVKEHASAKSFLKEYNNQPGCLVADVQMPTMNGLELQQKLLDKNIRIPIIFITGHGDIPMSVKALKAGAFDFIEKPFRKDQLVPRIYEALEVDANYREKESYRDELKSRFKTLTSREKDIMKLLVHDKGILKNKEIAKELNISRRTVEVHRSAVMGKMLANSRSELVEMSKVCEIN